MKIRRWGDFRVHVLFVKVANFNVADLAKIKRLLGYEPQVPFAEGIRRTVQWSLDWEERKE